MHLLLAIALLLPFRIDAGAYTGTYRVADGGAVNWYFATTALLRLRRLPLEETRDYLNVYLAHLDPYDGIADALPKPTGIFAPIAPDSEDAYAATILSLAARYRTESHDERWWSDHVATLSAIAYAKLLTKFKPDGLIRASGTDPTGYLMDNAEDYAGIRAFAAALRATHAPDAGYVASFVAPLGATIQGMFDESAHAYAWSDSDPLGPPVPYPTCAAQLFPQLLGVSSGKASVDRRNLQQARNYAAHCHFSPATDPHEALEYALFIKTLDRPTRSEATYVAAIRAHPVKADDIVVVSMLDAL